MDGAKEPSEKVQKRRLKTPARIDICDISRICTYLYISCDDLE